MTANAALVGLVALIAVNYVVTRSSLARRYPPLFWAINLADVLVALGVLAFGLPGVEGRPLVRVMVALVVLLHLAQNFQAKARWDAEDRVERLDAEYRERLRHEEARHEQTQREQTQREQTQREQERE